MLVWILVLVLVLACFLYIQLTPKDADPDFVAHQASISTTKLPGQSATFRSLVNDHKHSLLGSMAPLKNFQFIRLWDEVKSFRISVVSPNLPQPQPVTNFEQLVIEKQKVLGNEVLIEDCGLDALVTYFAAMLNGIVPFLPKFVMEDSHNTSANASADPTSNSSFSSSNTKGSSGLAMKIGSISISEVDLGVAIAAQLTATGSQYRWNSQDRVLVAPGPLTASSIVAMLTALSAKAEVLFAELGPLMDASQLLIKAKPSIIVSDDITMRTLAKQRDNFRVPQWVQYGYRRLRLAKGALTQPAMLPGFRNVRLIYSMSGADPQQWLDNSETADLRVLTGTQIVHVLAPNDGLPITQTCIGDYRSSSKLPGVVWGPPVPGLEIKIMGGALFVQRANHTDFEMVRTVDEPKLLKDGCLYVPVQRPVYSEEYFYTGEMSSDNVHIKPKTM